MIRVLYSHNICHIIIIYVFISWQNSKNIIIMMEAKYGKCTSTLIYSYIFTICKWTYLFSIYCIEYLVDIEYSIVCSN